MVALECSIILWNIRTASTNLAQRGGGLTVKIVTDSTCDVPQQLVRELDITVVPEYVRFGQEVYRDGIDINQDEFYHKLWSGPVYPSTSFTISSELVPLTQSVRF